MECQKEKNLKNCTCTYPGCPRKGMCCECIIFHRNLGEIPGCFFTADVEKSFNRSKEIFCQLRSEAGQT